jgi:DNA end-binding protein Ku
MAARSISTGTLSFGLVTVPIRLYTASESAAGISFNMLHAECGSRLKQQYVCPKHDTVVGRDEMVKGYQFAKDQYVTFTAEEIKALAEEPNRAIEITEFVQISQVDPIFFDHTYYLGPDRGGEKAYKLLAEAMKQTGRAAIAKWAAHGKSYHVLLRPMQSGLVMQVLHSADEIKPFEEVPVGDAVLKDSELKLAVQLIEQISTDQFQPQAVEDEVRKRIQAAIDQKLEGHQVTAATPEAPKAQIIDLMEALKASLAARPPGVGRTSAAAPERKTAGKRAKAEAVEQDEEPVRPRAAAGGRRR